MKTRIGILGGSFDPIHAGHSTVAMDATQRFGLAETLFVPCNRPSHKANARASAFHRMAMLMMGVEGHPGFRISDVDIRRGGITYSIDTVRDLLEELPGRELFFIIGSDTLLELHGWHAIDELLDLCSFAVMIRPGFEFEAVRREMRFAPQRRDGLLRHVARGRQVDISSSEIRRRIAGGIGVEGLIHPDVESYIKKHRLYKDEVKPCDNNSA